MSLRIVPSTSHPSSKPAATNSAPSAPGLPDTLRSTLNPHSTNKPGLSSTPTPQSAHPLETRLLHWQATQEALRMETLRRTFGMAEPIRRGMELQIVRGGSWRPGVGFGQGGKSVHEEVLEGGLESCEWEDVFVTQEEIRMGGAEVLGEVEGRVRMGA